MMLALADGALAEATPNRRGTCPGCDGPVLAKCGQLVTAHWAHVRGDDCDPWSEPESPWHQDWKRAYQRHGAVVEVPIGNHRADVVTPSGVVELQHSPLPLLEARAREDFYGGAMLWMFDMTDEDRWARVHFGPRGFWWRHGSRTQAGLHRPVYWHLPDGAVWRVHLATVPREQGGTPVSSVVSSPGTPCPRGSP